jgi:hypothetical protein
MSRSEKHWVRTADMCCVLACATNTALAESPTESTTPVPVDTVIVATPRTVRLSTEWFFGARP